MKLRGYALFLLGFLIATGIIAIGLYYHQIFFSICVSLSLVLATDKARRVWRGSRSKIVHERRIFYGIALVLFWMSAAVLMVVSATELSEVAAVLSESDINSVDSFVSKAKENLPSIISEEVFEPTRLSSAQDYISEYILQLRDETAFLLWYLPFMVPIFFFAYFFIRKLILWTLLCFVPEKAQDGFKQAILNTRGKLYDFIGAKVLQCLIIGIISSVGFVAAGLPGGFLLGMLAGAFNIVPYLGPLIGLAPALLIAVLAGDFIMLIYVVTTVLVAQLVDNFYLNPFMVSDKVKINAALAIGLALLGSHFYGALGLFFSLPIFVAYQSWITGWYQAMRETYGTGEEMEEYEPEEKMNGSDNERS